MNAHDAPLHVLRRDGVVWIRGSITDNRRHAHHALQVAWSAPGTLVRLTVARLSVGEVAGEAEFEGTCLIADGGTKHSLALEDGVVALIDATSALASRIRDTHLAGQAWATASSCWNGGEGGEEDEEDEEDELEALLASLAGDGPMELDARVRDVLHWLDSMEDAARWHEVTLSGALAVAHLSRSRFLHLFSEEVRSPWRTYLVWRRALVAMTLAANGASLTEAAHAAGYSDSAHLSRQFVSLFGVTPAAFAKSSHFVQSP